MDNALALVDAQAEQINSLMERVAQLENELSKAKKDSSNSSKPPSSDSVNPKKAAKNKGKRKRKPGGQNGHPKHERPDFPPESLNETWEYTLASCPLRGGGLEDADRAPRVVQQVEIIDVPIRIEAHRGRAYWCPSCQKFHDAPLPPEVEQVHAFARKRDVAILHGPSDPRRQVSHHAFWQSHQGPWRALAGSLARDVPCHPPARGSVAEHV